MGTLIRTGRNRVADLFTSDDVLEACRKAQSEGREIAGDYARLIATYYQSSGTIGSTLAALGSGRLVDSDDLQNDISQTIGQCYGEDADGDLMLDMLGTWAIHAARTQVNI